MMLTSVKWNIILGFVVTILLFIVGVLFKKIFRKGSKPLAESVNLSVTVEQIKEIAKLAAIECVVQVVVDKKEPLRFGREKKGVFGAKGKALVGCDLLKSTIREQDGRLKIELPQPEILSLELQNYKTYIAEKLSEEERDYLLNEALKQMREAIFTEDVKRRARRAVEFIIGQFLLRSSTESDIKFIEQEAAKILPLSEKKNEVASQVVQQENNK